MDEWQCNPARQVNCQILTSLIKLRVTAILVAGARQHSPPHLPVSPSAGGGGDACGSAQFYKVQDDLLEILEE